MKSKLTKYTMFLLIILILFIAYNFVKPVLIERSMTENYYSNRQGFNRLEVFLNKRGAALFPGDSDIIDKYKSRDNIAEKHLFDSLYTFLNEIDCENIYKYSIKGLDKKYLLEFHKEFLFPNYAYLIIVGGEKTLDKNWNPDGFYNYQWLDSNLIAGTLSWN